MEKLTYEQLIEFEKQLATLKNYSFDNLSRLKLINNSIFFLINQEFIGNTSIALGEIIFEINEEIESLNDLRYNDNKFLNFNTHVNTTKYFITKLYKHFPMNNAVIVAKKRLGIIQFIASLFKIKNK